MAKEAQKEFNNTPERTPLGKVAVKYLKMRDEIENTKTELDRIKSQLIQEFIKTGKSDIKVENHTISYSHGEIDKITVKTQRPNP